jgi:hypothetical protein
MIIALSSTLNVLAIIGLVVGLVVLLLVIFLLQSTLAPLRAVLTDVSSAKTAPMLERGVPGTDQLGTTRRLAESVPPLALAYLNKLGAGGARSAPPPAAAAPAAAPGGYTPPYNMPAQPPPPPAASDDPNLPGWQRFQARNR